jgi:hypothetical protein
MGFEGADVSIIEERLDIESEEIWKIRLVY